MSTTWYAKIDCNFHSNRKSLKAGRLGREVYVFVLCVNAQRGGKGFVPKGDLEPWYVAKMLQMSEAEAEQGIRDCVSADLIEFDNESAFISGWNADWAKRPLTTAERKRKERNQTEDDVTKRHDDNVTERDSHDGRDVSHRKEGRKEGREGEKDPLAFDPTDAPQRGRLAQEIWNRLSDIRVRLAKELGIGNVMGFTPITPASANQRGYRDLVQRIQEEGTNAPAVCNRVLEVLTADAREKRSIEWLSEKAFSEGAWRTSRESVPKWRKTPVANSEEDVFVLPGGTEVRRSS